ncbi:hypothetical protein ACFC58_03205 [Kitasatospora purpeofusca]|uniref:hypothetical protein n=1 Tax=Kitasatospora purpeofusca TaxID=67352 RepID=UPI0035DFDAB3
MSYRTIAAMAVVFVTALPSAALAADQSTGEMPIWLAPPAEKVAIWTAPADGEPIRSGPSDISIRTVLTGTGASA